MERSCHSCCQLTSIEVLKQKKHVDNIGCIRYNVGYVVVYKREKCGTGVTPQIVWHLFIHEYAQSGMVTMNPVIGTNINPNRLPAYRDCTKRQASWVLIATR